MVTWIGYLLMPLAVVLAATNLRWLSYLVIFFAPFSATSVFNVSSVTFGLQPSTYCFFLFFLALLVTGAPFKSQRIPSDQLVILTLLGILAVYVGLSQVANVLTNRLEIRHITQSAYAVSGIAAGIVFGIYWLDPRRRNGAIVALQASATFVAAWGLFQFLCGFVGIQYPGFLFNNSISNSAGLFEQYVQGIRRISSVSVEPSFMAFSLLHFISYGTTLLLFGIRPNRYFTLSVLLSLVCAVLSTSTSAYLGLLTLAILQLWHVPGRAIPRLVGGAAVLFLMIPLLPGFIDALSNVTVEKASGYSFTERFGGIERDLELFTDRPLLGWGWGTAAVRSLPVDILVNTGLLGLTLFIAIVGFTLFASVSARRAVSRHLPEHGRSVAVSILGFQNAFVVSIVVQLASGLKYVVLDFWLVWAFLLSLIGVARLSIRPGAGPLPQPQPA